MMKNKTLWAAVAIVAVLLIWWFMKGGGIPEYGIGQPTESPSAEPASGTQSQGQSQSGQTGVVPGGTPVALNLQAYSDLVRQYEGRRVEFDERCQMRPNDVTFKNGTVVMFDNRSPQTKTIKIGSQSYSLQAYGYRVLTMNSQNVPLSLNVGCDNVPSVGRLLLQANILEQF